jgi:hypothetical protein
MTRPLSAETIAEHSATNATDNGTNDEGKRVTQRRTNQRAQETEHEDHDIHTQTDKEDREWSRRSTGGALVNQACEAGDSAEHDEHHEESHHRKNHWFVSNLSVSGKAT